MTPIHPQHITRALQHARTPEETSALLNALAASPGHLMTLGTTTAGRPLDALVLGSGAPRTVVIGGAHANEPAGTAAVLTLALHLTDSPHHPTGTWYLMPCLDPDGAARNPWRRLPSPTLADYHAAFWRPARAAHPEALLPTDSEPAPLPETAALQRLLDTARPHTLLTLHNSDTGGVFTITTDPD
uniref:M14 family zinc carboxypeptidase n=2 Tax=Streptomyces TaxID=1883 RepID=UPI002467B542